MNILLADVQIVCATSFQSFHAHFMWKDSHMCLGMYAISYEDTAKWFILLQRVLDSWHLLEDHMKILLLGGYLNIDL